MFCGTSKSKSNVSNKGGIDDIKAMKSNIQKQKIRVDLPNGTLVHKSETGKWNSLFQNDLSAMNEEERKQYKLNLQMKLQNKNEEFNEIEKLYLAKLVRLCIMMQMHCDLKRGTTQVFKSHGIDVRELEQYERDESYYNANNEHKNYFDDSIIHN